MGNLIDDLLFLSRSEADELRFTFAPVSLTKVVSEAVQDAAVLARDRNVRIAFEGASTGPVVRADARRLKQAVLIVLDNAAKYADPETGVTVRVAADAGDAEVRVRDHGTGIPPEEIPHVFQRFYRGARARHGDGSGLGLPIARWIVEKHQGSIDLSSAPGEGTEVRIALRPVNAA
jgi:signal transduction histidine kinase